MPKSNPYKQGSIVYFQGDRADKIFVLQSGVVDLCTKNIETGYETHDLVQRGEFFGVKSALGGYPREELASVLADSVIMTFTVPEFEAFARNNTRIVLKMLKVFSKQLREVNKQLSTVTKDEETTTPEEGLFNVAKFYIQRKRLKESEYVLRKYIETYPSGNNIAEAKAQYAKIAAEKA
ncbi:MAG: cyclic nucleotide-binding domain-containing protein [Spirochaetaceae bacterium]|jgi:CRP-like cAMP-binding protein|nr:cyclic nucleotide-binding domain-containing protein [Spirochaetaceae bacterium]